MQSHSVVVRIEFRLWFFKAVAYGLILPMYWVGLISSQIAKDWTDSLADMCTSVREG